MKIGSSQVGMESSRSYHSEAIRKSKVTVSQSKLQGPLAGFGAGLGDKADKNGNSLEDVLSRWKSSPKTVLKPDTSSTLEQLEKANQIKQQCIRYIIQLFFRESRKNSLFGKGDNDNSIQKEQSGQDGIQPGDKVLNSYEYTYGMSYSEQENTSFSTEGKVVTEEGREIPFQLEFEMSRSFSSYYEEHYEVFKVSTCDPLVINLDGNIAEVSDQKFLFDLDADGKENNISNLRAGSGYLALDRNGDGIINNGGELFGTRSGDGFADLAVYDEDGNGWIDENDAVFESLKIWCRDERGREALYTLKQKGVGAICIHNAKTDFSQNCADDNRTNAFIRKTGIFLYENGAAGTVQHLDLVK